MSFNVIPPLQITTAMLVNSTVAEPDAGEVVYNPATTYALDAQVISTTTHRKYQSLQAGNTGKALPVWPARQNLWWYDIGPTNRFAMFDLYRNTASKKNGVLEVTLAPGVRIDSLALRGLVASSVDIQMTSNGNVVYAVSRSLNVREVRNAYEYCFKEFEFQSSVTLLDLPPYSGAQLKVTLQNTNGGVECASMVIGQRVEVGTMLAEAESDTLNFSTIERDPTGLAILQSEPNAPTLVSQILVPIESVRAVRRLRDKLAGGVPAIFSGISDDAHPYAEAVDICGIYKKFTINLKNQAEAIVSLQLESISDGANPTTST